MKTGDLVRKHGIPQVIFYGWKAKFGGMDVSEAKRLRALEEESGKLKRLLGDTMLDNAARKGWPRAGERVPRVRPFLLRQGRMRAPSR
jgi:putative transposase